MKMLCKVRLLSTLCFLQKHVSLISDQNDTRNHPYVTMKIHLLISSLSLAAASTKFGKNERKPSQAVSKKLRIFTVLHIMMSYGER